VDEWKRKTARIEVRGGRVEAPAWRLTHDLLPSPLMPPSFRAGEDGPCTCFLENAREENTRKRLSLSRARV
jgi:hypothetical protein